MIKYILGLFRKTKPPEGPLLHPEGKRYYKDVHGLKKEQMDEDALKIIHRLSRYGHKAFLVGGCIRDLLLNRKPKDFDIATSATPNQIKNIFNNCRIIGRRFRIVHVIFKGKIIEVTTFRSLPDHRLNKNVSTDGKDPDYFLKRDNNYGTTKEDASRRDFTVNALYYDPRNETIVDFVGGYDDIKSKTVRVVGDPEISFKEDPVRMLRAVKISVLHGLEIEKKTKAAIKKNRIEMEKASTSRMLEEYNKIFRTWETARIFQGLAENFLLEILFKEALEITMKIPKWQERFLETPIGKRLAITDRKQKEREEITPVIYYSLIFSEIVADALTKQKGNMVTVIKTTLDPIFKRLAIPKRDQDRLVKVFASQRRFWKTNDSNAQQTEIFRSKDFFYESFMFFKLDAEARDDQPALQAAFFWEISTRIRPDRTNAGKPKRPYVNKYENKGINHYQDKPFQKYPQTKEVESDSVKEILQEEPKKPNVKSDTQNPRQHHPSRQQHPSHQKKQVVKPTASEEIPLIDLEESTEIVASSNEDKSNQGVKTQDQSERKNFYKKKYRGKKFNKRFPKKNLNNSGESNPTPQDSNPT